jgi:hypothetical protein
MHKVTLDGSINPYTYEITLLSVYLYVYPL